MRRLVLVAAVTMLFAGAIPARAGTAYVAWPPGSTYANPTLSAAVMQQGDDLQYANLDLGGHNIVASITLDAAGACTAGCGPDANEWCGPIRDGGPRRFPLGQCPAFISALTGISQVVPVQGAAALAPGMYSFHCAPHGWMNGTLEVVAKP